MWSGLQLEYAVAATDAAYARAHCFENQGRINGAEKGVELALVAGQLDDVGGVGDVDDAGTKDVGGTLDLFAVLAGGAHLDQHELALEVRRLGNVHHLEHLDELVQLLGDLLDDVVRAGGDDGHA